MATVFYCLLLFFLLLLPPPATTGTSCSRGAASFNEPGLRGRGGRGAAEQWDLSSAATCAQTSVLLAAAPAGTKMAAPLTRCTMAPVVAATMEGHGHRHRGGSRQRRCQRGGGVLSADEGPRWFIDPRSLRATQRMKARPRRADGVMHKCHMVTGHLPRSGLI